MKTKLMNISKAIAFGIICTQVGCSTDNFKMTPKQVERYVLSINGGRNIEDGAYLEEKFQIKKRDGKWNCIDRAALAVRILKENGYVAAALREYDEISGEYHKFVKIYGKDGEEILHTNYLPSQESLANWGRKK
jgi:hypothetical protein